MITKNEKLTTKSVIRGKSVSTVMEMSYERITPDIAKKMLEGNIRNRSLSKGTVSAYADDIIADNWDEETGSAICFDKNGLLRDGQHRLASIIKANVPLNTWVCRNVTSDGIYDSNRRRTNVDQIKIKCPDLESIYKSNRYVSVARILVAYSRKESLRRKNTVTASEIIDFTNEHKEELNAFFSAIPVTRSVPKISVAVVIASLYSAYAYGIDINKIEYFYNVLCDGVGKSEKDASIIAYRDYLLRLDRNLDSTIPDIARCQYALKKYLTGSCSRRTYAPNSLVYPFPYKEE